MDEMHFLPATEIIEKIHNKTLSVEEVIINLLKRIKSINEDINALVFYDETDLLHTAKKADEKIANNKQLGPLFGLPITIKDNIEVAKMVTTGGIKGRKDFIPSFDATVVQRLKQAGAIILGKTNCPAFCAGYETTNDLYGQTNNPYDLNRTVGSSSGGEAALIASGGSFLGLGSDTGGSIRWPSSFCGIASLVPTFGRVPRTGTIPPYLGFLDTTQIGPMARTIRDLIPILPIIMGPDNWDSHCMPMPFSNPYKIKINDLRIAYYTDNGYVTPEKSVKKVISNVADILTERNLTVEEKCPEAAQKYLGVVKGLNTFSANVNPKTAPSTKELTEPIEFYPARIYDIVDEWLAESKKAEGEKAMLGVEYQFWSYKWDTYRSKMMQFMDNYDAIICPVSAIPAFEHGMSSTKEFNGMNLLSYTHPYSFVGFPSVTFPGGQTNGLPIGIQILTAHGQEALALKLGLLLEESLEGWQKPARI
ncbi:MAG: amidase [Asgard group archaeon]|nr:amidase [Asgard group archaeon]